MSESGRLVLTLTAQILGGFGVLVAIWSLIAKWKGRDAKSIWVKYLAWFLIIPPLILPLVFNRVAYQIVILVLSLLCFREYHRAIGLWRDQRVVALGYVAIISIHMPIWWYQYGIYQAMPIFAVAILLTIPMQRNEYEHMIQKTCLVVLGVIYFGWFLSHLACLRNLPNGLLAVFYLFVLVEANDAFAYLWGSLLGKKKLISNISPNKTTEGAIGAWLSVIGLALVMRFCLPYVTTFHIILIASIISVFGVCGDLTISFIKRDLKIKDMGNIIPGHGGLLDRFDSIIFTAPLYFHFLRYFYGE